MPSRKKLIFLAIAVSLPALPEALHAATCESLTLLHPPHTTITSATLHPSNARIPTGNTSIQDLPEFCRVTLTLTPTPDSNIRVELWLPTTTWNGKFEGTGNGGFAGAISIGSLAEDLRRGYAVANTDMGTAPASTIGGDVLINHPERWADWGFRATHEMTLAAKIVLQAFYGRPAQHAYFNGCSTGGEQALMEAQRYPTDYDGIISGAPAQNRTHLHMEIFWPYALEQRNPAAKIPPEKLPVLANAVLNACKAQKAVPTDAFLSQDPAACHFQPETLLCKQGDQPDCLTPDQLTTVQKIYQGPTNPTTHASIYPGVEPGSELSWNQFLPKDNTVPYGSIFRWVFGANWQWQSFDFNHDVTTMDTRLAPLVNATNPDLHAFRAAGGKLILFHGWADWLVPPRESLTYYNSVVSATSSLEATQSFARLFLVPGMGHCSNGPGLNGVETMASLERWVESGIAPASLPAWRDENHTHIITRPVCAYPQTARYQGTGDPNAAASFTCSAPEAGTPR